MEIKVFNNNVEKALKVAKKKLAGEGLFRELKRRRFYEKPSVRKKAKQREAQRRRQKWLSKRKPESASFHGLARPVDRIPLKAFISLPRPCARIKSLLRFES